MWALAGDPARLAEWFPGIVACVVDGSSRVITTGAGIPMPEEILVNDPVQRRFQYQVTAPLFRFHRGTIDVIDLGDETSLVVYSTDADPARWRSPSVAARPARSTSCGASSRR